jgi:hypothetical protein
MIQNWWWLVIPILAKALRGGGSPLTCKMRVAETTPRSLEPPLFDLEVGSVIPKRPKEKQLGELARTTPRLTDMGWSNPPLSQTGGGFSHPHFASRGWPKSHPFGQNGGGHFGQSPPQLKGYVISFIIFFILRGIRNICITPIIHNHTRWYSELKNDRNTSLLQQVYNKPLTWGGLHTLWGPSHVRGLLYTCCKSVVRESVLFWVSLNIWQLRQVSPF